MDSMHGRFIAHCRGIVFTELLAVCILKISVAVSGIIKRSLTITEYTGPTPNGSQIVSKSEAQSSTVRTHDPFAR